MKKSALFICTVIIAISAGLCPGYAAAGTQDPAQQTEESIDWHQASALTDTAIVQKNFWRTAIEVTGVNGLVWFFDRYIREGGTNPGFRIGFNSWAENLKNGLEWDDNSFSTNQFSHPYHGNLYFNAARSNGYDFWESAPFVFAGSLQWEFFGEVHHASMNDWIATSVGGIAVGEVLHRLSLTIRDNKATGSSRTWKELGGFVVDPLGGLNRIIDGDWSRVHANPVDQYPNRFRTTMDLGFRKTADENLWTSNDTTGLYAEFNFDYGDPFYGDMESPFDHFDFDLQLNFKDSAMIGRAELNGLLAGTFLEESKPVSHILGAFHHFDYVNNSKFKFGAQSLGAGLLSKYETSHGLEIRTELHANAILLGASLSDYETFSGRTYDYGPGASAGFSVEFGANGWHFLRVSHEQYYIRSINGTDADHLLGASRVALNVPVTANFGAGLEYVLYTSEKFYDDYENTSTRAPQLRLFTTMLLN
ncbi:MAG: DUF3943 domain-containing protein [Candidatus Krumholzibacteria bacterium]|nr:DUF3943 domain-containing protein [Candidatus Krumholzibacteria bacterium]